jgi:hypothetical protein
VKFSQLVALVKKYGNDPNAWIRVDDKTNGWNTTFLKEDVLLCIAFSVVFEQGKPVPRYDFKYGTTVFLRAEFPTATIAAPSTVAEALESVRSHIENLT